eukprot:TRINITY_DN4602_c0_g1_i1.p1 TRINITY_DN4602_c0_g1~~TRINITY_DN4602_c0_g1_i1.p1  ORF type:complete len:420 (-),score=75.95 TRINITY_DN4602_c0_g1_i1:48-1307(-)
MRYPGQAPKNNTQHRPSIQHVVLPAQPGVRPLTPKSPNLLPVPRTPPGTLSEGETLPSPEEFAAIGVKTEEEDDVRSLASEKEDEQTTEHFDETVDREVMEEVQRRVMERTRMSAPAICVVPPPPEPQVVEETPSESSEEEEEPLIRRSFVPPRQSWYNTPLIAFDEHTSPITEYYAARDAADARLSTARTSESKRRRRSLAEAATLSGAPHQTVVAKVAEQHTIVQPEFMLTHGTMCITEFWSEKQRRRFATRLGDSATKFRLDEKALGLMQEDTLFRPKVVREQLRLDQRRAQLVTGFDYTKLPKQRQSKLPLVQGSTKKGMAATSSAGWMPKATKIVTASTAISNESSLGEVNSERSVRTEAPLPTQPRSHSLFRPPSAQQTPQPSDPLADARLNLKIGTDIYNTFAKMVKSQSKV